MKHLVCGIFLLSTAALLAQAPMLPAPSQRNQTKATETAPTPQEKAIPAATLEQQIQSKLLDEPILKSSSVAAKVHDDDSVVLTGAVDSEQQHQRAVSIAASLGGSRKLIDRIVVRGTDVQKSLEK
jgi:osmotically-inducible protein OsmY